MLANTIAMKTATRWGRTGSARETLASFPGPAKRPGNEATIVCHSLRGCDRAHDRGRRVHRPRRCCWGPHQSSCNPLERTGFRVSSSMLTRVYLGMRPDFEMLAALSLLAASSQVRKPEIENSIWNASLEIGKRNEYRHGTYRPPYEAEK